MSLHALSKFFKSYQKNKSKKPNLKILGCRHVLCLQTSLRCRRLGNRAEQPEEKKAQSKTCDLTAQRSLLGYCPRAQLTGPCGAHTPSNVHTLRGVMKWGGPVAPKTQPVSGGTQGGTQSPAHWAPYLLRRRVPGEGTCGGVKALGGGGGLREPAPSCLCFHLLRGPRASL